MGLGGFAVAAPGLESECVDRLSSTGEKSGCAWRREAYRYFFLSLKMVRQEGKWCCQISGPGCVEERQKLWSFGKIVVEVIIVLEHNFATVLAPFWFILKRLFRLPLVGWIVCLVDICQEIFRAPTAVIFFGFAVNTTREEFDGRVT